jgi:hypothetical protein
MLSVVLRGKLAITEDVLTAAVFDAFASSADVTAIRDLVTESRGLIGTPTLPAYDAATLELWPRLSTGEPDVRITLLSDQRVVGTVLVEAKLGASKSGQGMTDSGYDEPPVVDDQLARYLIGQARLDPTCVLIYLAHHATMPAEDLQASAACLGCLGRGDLASRLYWLPWRDVERIIARRMQEGADYGRVRDVLRRAEMWWFDGMRITTRLALAGSPAFYGAGPDQYRWPTVAGPARPRWRYATSHTDDWPTPPTALNPASFYRSAR